MIIKLFRRLLHFARPYRAKMIVAILFNTIANFLNSISITAILPIVSIILGEGDLSVGSTKPSAPNNSIIDRKSILEWFEKQFTSGTRQEALIKLCAFIFITYALKNLFSYINNYLMSLVEGGMIKSLRDTVFEKLSNLSIDYYYQRKTGHLLSRINTDVWMVNYTLVSSIVTLIGQPLQIAFFLWLMFTINTKLTLVSFGIALLSLWLVNFFGSTIKKLSHRVQDNMGDLMTIAQEMISGIKVVKSFGMEKYEVERFKSETSKYFKVSRRLARIRQTLGPLNETLAVAGFIGILYFGGQEVLGGQMKGSELLFFLITLVVLMQPIRSLSELSGRLHEGSAAAENLFSILDAEQSVKTGSLPAPVAHDTPIKLENVHFQYTNATENALNGIDLEIYPNEVIALVGPSGAGKTTLVDLIVRFYDPTQGRIILGGRDIKEYELSSLRNLFGVVTQDTVLFHDTILNNIAYGNRDASKEMIYAAAKAANAHEFISQMPEGYETVVGDRGVRLSGGQRQRIAIARALLKNPPLLIFDEATSALDTENEMLVQQAIERLLKQRTAIVIAHRLSTIQQADRIVVVDQGKIVEIGTHEELLQNKSGLYQRLYSIQTRAASEGLVDLSTL